MIKEVMIVSLFTMIFLTFSCDYFSGDEMKMVRFANSSAGSISEETASLFMFTFAFSFNYQSSK